jgi:RND family efflux transporter MFP subunit
MCVAFTSVGCRHIDAGDDMKGRNVVSDQTGLRFKATSDSVGVGVPAVAWDVFETVLVPIGDVEIRAQSDGVVEMVSVEEGSQVARDVVLAQVDDRERKTDVEESEALLDRAASAWERAQKLHDAGLVADEPWIMARSEWAIARARRARAALSVERCVVRSPIGGIVALRCVQRGQTVRAGELLFRVSDPSHLRAEIVVPESRLGTIHLGEVVHIVIRTSKNAIAAKVTRVGRLVDPASGMFRIAIDIDNRRLGLPCGIAAQVLVPTAGGG